MDRQRLDLVHVVEAVSEVRHQAGAQLDVNSGGLGQAAGHFVGSVCESGAEAVGIDDRVGGQSLLAAQLVEVAHCQLEDVGLLQLGHVLAFGLQSCDHQVLELVQATIDAGTTLALQHRLHHFAVLVGAGDGLHDRRGGSSLHDH